jgi:hypothetical protein
MFNKKSLTILLLNLHLAISLKSSNFCSLRQVKKCPSEFANDCGSNVCSHIKTECNEYNKLDSYLQILTEMQYFYPMFSGKHLEEKDKIMSFVNNITDCQIEGYKFESTDFCLNGRICRLVHRFRYRKITEEYECKCPIKQRFKCGKYCAKDSVSCDYFKSNEKSHYFDNIKDCGNHFF